MKIELGNSIRKLSFFVPSTGHQNCLDKSLVLYNVESLLANVQVHETTDYILHEIYAKAKMP